MRAVGTALSLHGTASAAPRMPGVITSWSRVPSCLFFLKAFRGGVYIIKIDYIVLSVEIVLTKLMFLKLVK